MLHTITTIATKMAATRSRQKASERARDCERIDTAENVCIFINTNSS